MKDSGRSSLTCSWRWIPPLTRVLDPVQASPTLIAPVRSSAARSLQSSPATLADQGDRYGGPVQIPLRARRRLSIERRRVESWRRDRRHARSDRRPIFCNSVQKAGTHLLVGLVNGIPGVEAYGGSTYWHYLSRAAVGDGFERSSTEVGSALSRCRRGEVYRGHVAFDPAIESALQQAGATHLLIARDPRAVVVSLFHFWMDRGDADTWPYRLFGALPSKEEKIDFLIRGWPDDPGAGLPRHVDYPDIGTRIAEYAGWVSNPRCTVVRFEELTGPDSHSHYRSIAQLVAPDTDPVEYISAMAAGADPSKSKTYRVGGASGWSADLTAAQTAEIEHRCSDLPPKLGLWS